MNHLANLAAHVLHPQGIRLPQASTAATAPAPAVGIAPSSKQPSTSMPGPTPAPPETVVARRLQDLARALGQSVKIRLEPGDSWSYDRASQRMTYPQAALLNASEDARLGAICHEVGRALYSRSETPNDSLGMRHIWNVVENMRTGRMVGQRFAGANRLLNDFYSDTPANAAAPKSQQFIDACMHQWLSGKQPQVADADVRRALANAQGALKEATQPPPAVDMRFDAPTDEEVQDAAHHAREVVQQKLWPIYKQLLEEDMQDASPDAAPEQAGEPSDVPPAPDPDAAPSGAPGKSADSADEADAGDGSALPQAGDAPNLEQLAKLLESLAGALGPQEGGDAAGSPPKSNEENPDASGDTGDATSSDPSDAAPVNAGAPSSADPAEPPAGTEADGSEDNPGSASLEPASELPPPTDAPAEEPAATAPLSDPLDAPDLTPSQERLRDLIRQALGKHTSALDNAPASAPQTAQEADQTHNAVPDLDALMRAYEQELATAQEELAARGRYQDIARKHQRLIHELVDELENYFARNDMPKFTGHFISGSYDPKRAMQAAFEQAATGHRDPRLFRRRLEPVERNIDVILCVDTSGSMHGDRLEAAAEATVVLQEALSELHVPFGVLRFDDTVELLKPLDKSHDPSEREALLELLEPGGMTNDLAAVQCAAEMLENRRSTEQYILFLTDGMGERRTPEAVRRLDSEMPSLKILGVGIGDGCESVKKTYLHSLAVDNIDELPRAMGTKLAELLQDCG